jgi:hypothetical protein
MYVAKIHYRDPNIAVLRKPDGSLDFLESCLQTYLCSLQFSGLYNAFWLRCSMYSTPFTKNHYNTIQLTMQVFCKYFYSKLQLLYSI